ncbi:MAG: sigma-70 family RNA polymerase sigma factor [Candidatus Aminicenantes bacterium]|nr:sigma-70 family RNA polymerase sigma factor [Candidatus Aminicenantes bacterium]
MRVEETMSIHPASARETGDLWQELLGYRDKVFCLCLGFVGNAADARDLTQDTFAKALSHCRDVEPGRLQAWIMRIARNTCLDMARRRKARGAFHPVSECSAVDLRTPENNAGAEDEIRVVRKAIASLPRRQRDVLVMREYGELSYQEIAAALRVSVGTVMSRLNRARQAVLRFYREEHHGKTT